ncbi:unnamed protein product [Prunus armeniaca]
MRQSLMRGLRLNAMEVSTASSAQGEDKYAGIRSGGDQHRGVSKAKRPILVYLTSQLGLWIKKIGSGGWGFDWICYDAHNAFLTLYEEL